MMKKQFKLMALFLTMTILLAACGSTPAPTPPAAPKVLTLAQFNPPTGLFVPDLLLTDYDGNITSMVFEPMLNYNPDMEFYGILAESWTVAEDNLSVTFHLRPNVTWHDGKPFTAEDVKFTLMFVGHPDYTGPRYSNVAKILGMKDYHEGNATDVPGLEIIDPLTLKITTDGVYGSFLYSIGTRPIMAKHIWEKVDVATAETNTAIASHPVGTGPFKFKEFVPDSHAELVKFEKYWGGVPKIDTVILKAAAMDTASTQMVNGGIDSLIISDFNPTSLKLLTDAKITIEFTDTVTAQFMSVNTRLDKLKDKAVRQGLATAINRQQIVDELLYGKANVLSNPYTPASWADPGPDAIDNYAYDKERAIKLFTSAEGYTYENGVMKYNGEPVKYVIKYPSGNKAREQSAVVIQQNLKDIGIEVELVIMEFAALISDMNVADFEFLLIGMGTSFDPDQNYIWEVGSGFNACGWDDEYTFEMLDEGLKYVSVEDRKPIYQEWAIYMNEQMPNVWLYNPQNARAFAPRFVGWEFGPSGFYYQMHNWDIK
jgi:peptide/nickel transport system substrate-binding protein